ncbi:ribonuclease Y [Candidatus Dojkabacteria bacterium]|nr:ribonuclease Y [Candidatus Dojkabacteria bacterium]
MAGLIILGLVSAVSIAASVYLYTQNTKLKSDKPDISEEEAIKLASDKASKRIEDAENEADEILSKAKTKANKVTEEANKLDAQLVERETNLLKRERLIQKRVDEANSLKEDLQQSKQNLEKIRKKLEGRLEKISGLSKEEAKEKLMREIEEDLKEYHAKKIREIEKKVVEESDEKAKEILVETMQKVSTDYVGETTVATVKLDDEKMKGRIIGREGRNIRAFEKATGVDVIVDESPDAIALSSFDPLRREVASIAMKKLIADGRIHPGMIEDHVSKAKSEVAKEIKESGQELAEEADWPGIDPGLLKLVGKMKYRTSYGQNLMAHTIEVIRIGAALAQELGADVDLVKKACLLHDVGKVLTHKVEGSHHHLSGEVARKYALPEKLINAIEAHHLDIEPQSIEAVIVYLADAISGARPGARKDSYESYIKRVKGIEDAAAKVAGGKASEIYAIHAGREVRVIVKPEMIDDDEAVVLAKKITDEIEKSQTYPGTVQVTVVRESRAVSVAK